MWFKACRLGTDTTQHTAVASGRCPRQALSADSSSMTYPVIVWGDLLLALAEHEASGIPFIALPRYGGPRQSLRVAS